MPSSEALPTTTMKEYRLIAWTELPADFQGTAYLRMLNDMSNRYRSLKQLTTVSGVRREEVREFLNSLESRGLLLERELFGLPNEGDAPRSLLHRLQRQLKKLVARRH